MPSLFSFKDRETDSHLVSFIRGDDDWHGIDVMIREDEHEDKCSDEVGVA